MEGFISGCSMIKVGVLPGFLSLREREHRDDIQPYARVLDWRTSMRRWWLGRVAFKAEGDMCTIDGYGCIIEIHVEGRVDRDF